MTAEIAILNKAAVALAADSAVTIGGGRKIYNTVNKLFALSKFYPVGIMVYGNSEFMGVPWETIIKQYRKELDERSFDRLTDYAEDFIRFIADKSNPLFGGSILAEALRNHIIIVAQEQVGRFASRIRKRALDELDVKEDVDERVLEEFETEFLDKVISRLDRQTGMVEEADLVASVPEYRKFIEEVIEQQITPPIPLSDANKAKLVDMLTRYILKEWNNTSGVVVAGFGEGDTFPCIVGYNVEGIYGEKLKYQTQTEKRDGHQGSARIVPFAQSVIVERFIEGVDPNYQREIDAILKKLEQQFPDALVSGMPDMPDPDKAALKKKIRDVVAPQIEEQKRRLNEYRNEKFVLPILTNLENLPKEELASMAEALVNITLFKQRISIDDSETVGGAIDVAIISKGDGFVWVKRKHYFDPKMNQHFFQNYYFAAKKRKERE